MTRTRSVVVPLALVALVGAGCSGGSTPPTTTSSSAVPTTSAGLAPPITNPLSLDKVKDNPCTLLKPAQVTAVVAKPQGEPGSDVLGKNCTWSPAETLTGSTISLTMDLDSGGLEAEYGRKTTHPFFEPAQVAGYPSVRTGSEPKLERGACVSQVGVNKDQKVYLILQMRNNNSPEYKTPCVVSDRLAAQVIENIKAAG